MTRKVSFAERLREGLTLRKMQQKELSDRTGIPKSALSQYCKGSFVPKQQRTALIAEALDVNEAWLMGFDVANEPPVQKVEASVLLKEPNGEQTDILHTVPTCELVEELRHRDGVVKIVADLDQDISVHVNGPAIVLVVID